MYHPPDYLGYVPVAQGQPTLFFDTGFLVQSSHDPAQCGWYSHVRPYQIAAHISADRARMLVGESLFNTVTAILRAFDPVAIHAPNLPADDSGHLAHMSEVRAVPARLPVAQDGERLILSDTDTRKWQVGRPMYLFPGPLVQVGTPGFNPAFDEHHAMARLGPLDGSGRPTQQVHVAPRTGLVIFK